MNRILLAILSVSLLDTGFSRECGLSRNCVTLRECPLIMQQLRLAQSARADRSFGAMNNILAAIRSTMCDAESRTVCCPMYLGTLDIEKSSGVSPVYALNSTSLRLMDFPMVGENDVLEPYFWRDTECMPYAAFTIIDESFSFTYSAEKTYLDLNLPPSLPIQAVRCMAVWKNNDFIGYAHLRLPVDEVEVNNVEE